MKHNILFARFPYGRVDEPDVTDWLLRTVIQAKRDPRIGETFFMRENDTPITMTRNKVLKAAKALGADFTVMVDNDMNPDAYHESNPTRLALDPSAKPFWETSFNFMLQPGQEPCVVAAPYCGPPPHENCYIFHWIKAQSDHPNVDLKLDMFTREDACRWSGIVEVAALPTGLIIIDMRVLQKIKPPYFKYEYKDVEETEKSTTEDVYFTRDLSLAGVQVFCNWDAWAGHWKRKCVGKPTVLTVDAVREDFRECLRRNHHSQEKRVIINGPPPVGNMKNPFFPPVPASEINP